jgi:eukaryotic-like serine/threonine-protein kinase
MSKVAHAQHATGQRVASRYRITRPIGAGGMGTVYEAVDEQLGRSVAIKTLDRGDALAQARLLREAKIVARIDHPNVVRLFDAGRDPEGDIPFLAMELLAGRDLARTIEASGPVPVDRAVRWVLEAAAGVGAAHAQGIVHRDLKPSNLFVRDDTSSVVVLDFGASRGVDVDADALTRTAMGVGTPLYSAPEQLADARSADARSDVWALGLVLYELLSATRPFQRPTMAAIGAAIVRDEPPPLDQVPPKLDAVVRRCLEKNAARRFASVSAFARALAPWGSAALVDAVVRTEARQAPKADEPRVFAAAPVTEEEPLPKPRQAPRRSPLVAALSVTATLVVAIVLWRGLDSGGASAKANVAPATASVAPTSVADVAPKASAQSVALAGDHASPQPFAPAASRPIVLARTTHPITTVAPPEELKAAPALEPDAGGRRGALERRK